MLHIGSLLRYKVAATAAVITIIYSDCNDIYFTINDTKEVKHCSKVHFYDAIEKERLVSYER